MEIRHVTSLGVLECRKLVRSCVLNSFYCCLSWKEFLLQPLQLLFPIILVSCCNLAIVAYQSAFLVSFESSVLCYCASEQVLGYYSNFQWIESAMSGLTLDRVSSRNFILGGGGEAHGLWPRLGEGRLHNYNYWQYLGGKLGQFGEGGGKLSCLGGKLPLPPP